MHLPSIQYSRGLYEKFQGFVDDGGEECEKVKDENSLPRKVWASISFDLLWSVMIDQMVDFLAIMF